MVPNYNFRFAHNYNDNHEDDYQEMEQQIQEEEYFDECWDLHVALMEYLEEHCIPIMQNCDISSFYKLCQYGKKYIVDLEKQKILKEQQRLQFIKNLNKPFPKRKNDSNWVTLGNKKKKSIGDLKIQEQKEEISEEDNLTNTNELSAFNWTKKKKKK